MLESDRKKAAQLLINAEAERKPVLQLSKTWPDITIEDAYAIQSEVIRHKVSGGAKVIGHKIGLTSKAMQHISNRRAGLRTPARLYVVARRCESLSCELLR